MSQPHGGHAGQTPNHLINETSPYLLQHAYNPVAWYPWGEQALRKAKTENKPILISIGYSSCHWCHVMAHECFENEAIAALMNEHFINIKVDREERPDLDHIYQTSAQLLGGGGGWPLNVFLTPDQRPFYAGTYFPPEDKFGRPGFGAVLRSIAKSFREQPERVDAIGDQITAALGELEGDLGAAEQLPGPELIRAAVEQLSARFDAEHGGFGAAPKFPYAENLELFLRAARRFDDASAREKVFFTLRRMAEGGIYDQLGGGFHRYSTDERWLVPHFEKMLYDNALLVPLYVCAHEATGDPSFARVVRETLAYVQREMTHPDGGFYATQDADSEGAEGEFFVWTAYQIADVLPERQAKLAAEYYGVGPKGNFELISSVLHVDVPLEALAERHGLDVGTVRAELDAARATLVAAREQRVHPGRDEKILAGWNGLMISAFARAGGSFGESAWVTAARRAADFLLDTLWDGTRLGHQFLGRPGATPGFLDDYAFCAQGLIDLYEVTFEARYLDAALGLTDQTLHRFWDEAYGGFFDTPADGERLIHRPKRAFDQATPAGNAIAVSNLVRLAGAADDRPYLERAEAALRAFAVQMEKNPWGTAALLCALDRAHAGTVDVVIAGERESALTHKLIEVARRADVPSLALYVIPPEGSGSRALFAGKSAHDGRSTAYVCRNFTCSPPVHDGRALSALLQASR